MHHLARDRRAAGTTRRGAAGLVLLLLVVAGAVATPVMAQAPHDTPVGLWRTFSDEDGSPRGLVRITERAGVLFGTLVASLVPGDPPDQTCDRCPGERKGKPMVGLEFLAGLTRDGDEWRGGEILDPDSGTVYRASLRLDRGGTALRVRGYVGLSLFGRSQTWERVE